MFLIQVKCVAVKRHTASRALRTPECSLNLGGTNRYGVPMTAWDLTPDEALNELVQWQHTTTVMQIRIMEPGAGAVTRQGDAYLFAMAARQALRFAQLVRKIAPPAARSVIDRALNEFNQTSPDIEGVRNVLDHLDDYLRGIGLGYPAAPPEAYATELMQILRPSLLWYEATEATYRLHISPAPGHRLVLDVTRDAAAVRQLCNAIADALSP